ncbi:hypothetical protein SNOG_01960 [Parastagonospora nodorum SN15]|uniref:Phospholipase D N-terminal domain-containing protein n=1 Tax=Phaeosphaeria nodorum (strain SN15 / ATCC MYA-4574 / FGSC 10173) TaxID=321614 RepID=Q0V204_PHANO|nr:hypothetical protein SNOG_01960 [Parastagonospora nodorum SN15]EAT90172.1 hypothetical protein SNOG_01960 [Parastagonospora nodorum SN15]
MKLHVLSLLASASVASASWSKNLNYRSPSEHHPSLGISIHRVVKRNDPSYSYDPASLNFTHGVASGDPYPSSIILWTRERLCVEVADLCGTTKVASDKNLSSVVDSGKSVHLLRR